MSDVAFVPYESPGCKSCGWGDEDFCDCGACGCDPCACADELDDDYSDLAYEGYDGSGW